MARLRHRDQIDETSVGVYHCINRCARQAFPVSAILGQYDLLAAYPLQGTGTVPKFLDRCADAIQH
jgi:hypothetical protein